MRNVPYFHPRADRRKLTPRELCRLKKTREAWYADLEPTASFQRLFDHIPGLHFFAKDKEGRTMFCSRSILALHHMKSESEMLGLTDYDLNPRTMAEAYLVDDARILAGKAPSIERLELWFDRLGMPDWFMVTKLPLVDKKGRVQGVMGVLRRAADYDMQLPLFQGVAKAVEIIRRDYAKPVVLSDVATFTGQSMRRLQRRFQSAFGINPQEFLIRTRVLAAAKLLEETDLTATEVAAKCGFVDGSSFSQLFQRRTDLTPIAFRKKGVRRK
jgi:AraC-like DNA-binding protein